MVYRHYSFSNQHTCIWFSLPLTWYLLPHCNLAVLFKSIWFTNILTYVSLLFVFNGHVYYNITAYRRVTNKKNLHKVAHTSRQISFSVLGIDSLWNCNVGMNIILPKGVSSICVLMMVLESAISHFTPKSTADVQLGWDLNAIVYDSHYFHPH